MNPYDPNNNNNPYDPANPEEGFTYILNIDYIAGATGFGEAIIPYYVAGIDSNAFANQQVTKVTFAPRNPSLNFTNINDYAFQNCTTLTDIILPSTLENIGSYTFENCVRLTSIIIPENVTSIGDYAFNGCINLTSIIFESVNKYFNILLDIGVFFGTTLGINSFLNTGFNEIYYSSIREMYLNGGYVRSNFIDAGFDTNCIDAAIGGFDLTMNINNIQSASVGSSSTLLVIPNYVKSIELEVFANRNITSVYFDVNSNLQFIHYGSFKNCTNLTSITFPKTLEQIYGYAFQNCTGLTSIYFITNNSPTGGGLRFIYDNAFENCNAFSSIIIPKSIIQIGSNVFTECRSLTNITFEEPRTISPLIIGNNSFLYTKINNSSIKSLYLYGKTRQQLINYGLRTTNINNAIGGFDLTLGDYGVVLSAVLVSSSRVLVIPYTVKSITSNALSSISSYINSVDFDQASEVETISNGFQNCVNLTSITLPNSVTSIGDSVFQNCSNLTNITLTNNIRYIGNNAFQDCIKLSTIIIPSNIGNIENNVFQNCSSLTSIILPNTVTNIGNNAFKDCINLLTINIPSNINNIGNSTFQNCAKLTSITIPNIVTNIGISSFQDCVKLSRIIIPPNVTNIGNSAFQNCALLKTINMPCSANISNTAFNLCSDIELTITNSSTSNIIKTDYLNSNTSISSIIILKSVTGINDNAFYQCSNLKNITYQKI